MACPKSTETAAAEAFLNSLTRVLIQLAEVEVRGFRPLVAAPTKAPRHLLYATGRMPYYFYACSWIISRLLGLTANKSGNEPFYPSTLAKNMSSEGPAQSDSTDPVSARGNRIKIHNWPTLERPIPGPLTDDTPLIRYMKLETFLLLLLGDQMFIPTVKLLQRADHTEGIVPLLRARADELSSILAQHEEWLLQKAGNPNISSVEDENVRRNHTNALAEEAWRHALAKRRCVSCWNRSERQVNFMWRIYGDRGVAVYSTVGRMRRALGDAGAKGIVSPVLYIPTEDTIPRPDYDLLNQNYVRPYLFKDWSYSPEQEVRFVFEVDPRQTEALNGVLLNVRGKTIIDKVYFSQLLPSSEKLNLEAFVYEKRFSRSFFKPGEEPRPRPLVVESDLPPGIFPDLD